jgi:hypothetical protein
LHSQKSCTTLNKKPNPEIWTIEAKPDKTSVILAAMKGKITDHFKQGGRIKIIYPDGSPPQELLPNFTFKKWKN